MSDLVRGVVVAHADLAEALVAAVERISGVTGALRAISNDGLGPDELCARVREATEGGDAILFADLASGSCAVGSRRVAAESNRVAVLAGVNLPVLLDYVFHRDMRLAELTERLVERGRSALTSHLPASAGNGQG